MRAIWIGTICSAKTPMKTQSRPRKFSQDRAYAAIAASVTENSTAGTVMTSELTNDCPTVSASLKFNVFV